MKLTDNFILEEFHCKDGTKVPAELIGNIILLANNLQVLRDYIDAPIFINSAYRTIEYNKSVGGVKNSYHLMGVAADITAKDYAPAGLATIIEELIMTKEMKQGGIGIYPGFVHYDVRGNRARW